MVVPSFRTADRNRFRRRLGRAHCPDCGFAADLVTDDFDLDPVQTIVGLLLDECDGCPDCPGQLLLVVDPSNASPPMPLDVECGPAGST